MDRAGRFAVSLSVTVLGSAAMYATRERACSGYLVTSPRARIWMDAGGGTWRNLQNVCTQDNLDAIVLSHRHPDHTIDVFQCFHWRRYGKLESMRKIPLLAPAETLERLVGFSNELDESFELRAVRAGESVQFQDVSLSFHHMAHPPETVGVRLECDGSVVGYSSDTGPQGDLDGLAGGAQVFICEATFQESDEEWEGHMTAAQAGKAAASAGAERLVLTHLPDGRDLDISLKEARNACGDIDVQLAYDNLRIEL